MMTPGEGLQLGLEIKAILDKIPSVEDRMKVLKSTFFAEVVKNVADPAMYFTHTYHGMMENYKTVIKNENSI